MKPIDNGGSGDGDWDSEDGDQRSEDGNGELKGGDGECRDGDVETQLPRAKAPQEITMAEMRRFIDS